MDLTYITCNLFMPFYGINLYDMQFNKDETRVKLALTYCAGTLEHRLLLL